MPVPDQPALALNAAINLFVDARSSAACFEKYSQMNFTGVSLPDVTMVTRGCVLKMYHCGLKMDELRNIFWETGAVAIDPSSSDRSMEDMILDWEAGVGSADETLHWVKEPLFLHVHRMKRMPLRSAVLEFRPDSALWRLAYGVMDVMFVTACFKLPVMAKMGNLFWIFARELICLRVQSGDMLNSLLWGMVLSQTVIHLPPSPTAAEFFEIDSLVDPISAEISIFGCRQCEGRTTINVSSHASLVFLSSVRLSSLTFNHVQASEHLWKVDSVLGFHGWKLSPLKLFMNDVIIQNGGISISDYTFVHCNNLFVQKAAFGVRAVGVKRLFITGILMEGAPGVSTGFSQCETVLRTQNVCEISLGRLVINDCPKLFDVEVSEIMVFGNSLVARCNSMGSIMMPVSLRASFINVVKQDCPQWMNSGDDNLDTVGRTFLIARAPKTSGCRFL